MTTGPRWHHRELTLEKNSVGGSIFSVLKLNILCYNTCLLHVLSLWSCFITLQMLRRCRNRTVSVQKTMIQSWKTQPSTNTNLILLQCRVSCHVSCCNLSSLLQQHAALTLAGSREIKTSHSSGVLKTAASEHPGGVQPLICPLVLSLCRLWSTQEPPVQTKRVPAQGGVFSCRCHRSGCSHQHFTVTGIFHGVWCKHRVGKKSYLLIWTLYIQWNKRVK